MWATYCHLCTLHDRTALTLPSLEKSINVFFLLYTVFLHGILGKTLQSSSVYSFNETKEQQINFKYSLSQRDGPQLSSICTEDSDLAWWQLDFGGSFLFCCCCQHKCHWGAKIIMWLQLYLGWKERQTNFTSGGRYFVLQVSMRSWRVHPLKCHESKCLSIQFFPQFHCTVSYEWQGRRLLVPCASGLFQPQYTSYQNGFRWMKNKLKHMQQSS